MEPEERDVPAGGIRWRLSAAGPTPGRAVLLLHGFPEDHRSWRAQLRVLAEGGFRAHAVDLPGIGGTEAPPTFRVDDVAALIASLSRELSPEGVDLVGHDWGGIIACAVAALHPDAVRSLAVLCAAHPDVLPAALRNPRQLARSWYVGAFLLPGASSVASAANGRLARRVFPGAVAARTGDEVRNGVRYYRANMNPLRLRRLRVGRIRRPGLILHAGRDRYIRTELAVMTAGRFEDLRGFHVLDCGHFVHRECADQVNRLLMEFLRSAGGP